MPSSRHTVNMHPSQFCGKLFSRMYSLKRHTQELHTESHHLRETHGGITPLHPHGEVTRPPHDVVNPKPSQHDKVTHHSSVETNPPLPCGSGG